LRFPFAEIVLVFHVWRDCCAAPPHRPARRNAARCGLQESAAGVWCMFLLSQKAVSQGTRDA